MNLKPALLKNFVLAWELCFRLCEVYRFRNLVGLELPIKHTLCKQLLVRNSRISKILLKTSFPQGDFFRVKQIFPSLGIRNLIAIGATLSLAPFLSAKEGIQNISAFFAAEKIALRKEIRQVGNLLEKLLFLL